MNLIPSSSGNRVSTASLSIALLLCSGLWLAAACEYGATTGFKVDWSATPVFWVLLVVVTPAVCFGCGMILFDQRKRKVLGLLECWALVSAVAPVTLGTVLSVWAVRVLLLMGGA